MEKNMEILSDKFNKDELIKEFHDVVSDADALLKSTANIGGEKMAEVRSKAEQSLGVAKARLAAVQADVYLRAKAAAKVTDIYVHDNPWRSIGIAAGIGFVVGMLTGRR
jgi:ElaB/YqjD/DUF883 family membrane-anchored ribosome-binding protein